MAEAVDIVAALDIGCSPSPSGGGEVLVQTEQSCFLTFVAVRELEDGLLHRAGFALIEFLGCQVTQFGYPNDEGFRGHPLFDQIQIQGDKYTGIHEIHNSSWIRRCAAQNHTAFPWLEEGWPEARHFLFEFHENTLECIAHDLRAELLDEPYEAVFGRIAARVFAEE